MTARTPKAHPGEGAPVHDESRQAARALFARVMRVYLTVAAMSLVYIFIGLVLAQSRAPVHPEKARQVETLLKAFLVFMFFAVTIVSLGVQWMAHIVAARRYSHADVYPAARVVAAGQVVCLSLYVMFEALMLFYRLVRGSEPVAFVAGILAAAAAGFYFLRLPKYLLTGVYGEERG